MAAAFVSATDATSSLRAERARIQMPTFRVHSEFKHGPHWLGTSSVQHAPDKDTAVKQFLSVCNEPDKVRIRHVERIGGPIDQFVATYGDEWGPTDPNAPQGEDG